MGLVRIEYFFEEPRRFPWDVLGLYVPKVGKPHSYLCSILAPWASEPWREFMRSYPTMSELSRAVRSMEEDSGVLGDIHKYCEYLYKNDEEDRRDVATEVLKFLVRHHGFKDHMQQRLDHLYRSGLIVVPKDGLWRDGRD